MLVVWQLARGSLGGQLKQPAAARSSQTQICRQLKQPAAGSPVPPAIGARPGVWLYSIDDLGAACEANRRSRHREMPGALAIVDEETRRFMGDLHHRSTAPVIERLRAGWTETGDAELDRLFRRVPSLDDAARAEIRQAFERYAAKMLHSPLASLRNESRSGPPHGLLDALKRLFDLKE